MLKSLLLGGAIALASVASTNAATVSGVTFAQTEAGFQDNFSSGNFLRAAWQTPVGSNANASAGSITFTVDADFNLILDNYSADAGSSGASLTVAGSTTGLTGPSTPVGCTSLPASSNCFRIGNDAGDGDGTTLFANLAAGTYTFGFYEGNNTPREGSFTLAVTAVPVPAAGLLFGSALMGAAVLRRRSIQSKLGLPTA